MRVRFYIDSRTGQPHIYGHSVTESELEEVLSDPGERREPVSPSAVPPVDTCG